MFAQPLQFPTICVLAVPVVVIVPLPLVLIAEPELELTYTPQPLVRLGVPLISNALSAAGFRTITQPPPLASRVPVPDRAVTIASRKPSTAENNWGMLSLTRATTQYEIVTPVEVGEAPTPDWNVTFCRPVETNPFSFAYRQPFSILFAGV